MDEDLEGKSQDELKAVIIKLRDGVREHKNSSGQELCWFPVLKGLDQQLPNAPRVNDEL